MLTIAEQRLVSTSKEHKVLDPTWQEMLNQAVLKVGYLVRFINTHSFIHCVDFVGIFNCELYCEVNKNFIGFFCHQIITTLST